MPIITISRGSRSGAKELAECLAAKLGYDCYSREELSDYAIGHGVPVGRLQTAMLKPPRVYGRMGKERDLYMACATARLCELGQSGRLVYHGHAAHLYLPDVTHVFRVRVVSHKEFRIRQEMARLNLSREKAKGYIESVDQDRAKWVRFLFGVNWDDPRLYDVTINVRTMGAENAASVLCAMAELPNFQPTPASIRAFENRWLAARARFQLGMDRRTASVDLNVRADDGVVSVTYPPQQAEVSPLIPEVLSDLDGVTEVDCAIAQTNILWIQEACDPTSDVCANILEIARKWDAAVELLRFVPKEEDDLSPDTADEMPIPQAAGPMTLDVGRNGGIEDDTERTEREDEGLSATLDRLVQTGRSGGVALVHGSSRRLLATIDRRIEYSLVVLGDVFLGRSSEVRTRLRSELLGLLTDNLDSPVVDADDLRRELRFGPKQALQLAAFVLVTAAMYLAVFTNQEQVLRWLVGAGSFPAKLVGVVLVVLLVPIVAYAYGTSARLVMRGLSALADSRHRRRGDEAGRQEA